LIRLSKISIDKSGTIEEGQEVEFEIEKGPKGEQATNVVKL